MLEIRLYDISPQLQQEVEEKGAVAAQLRAISQTLRDTQNRCHWLETQVQGQSQVNNPKLVCRQQFWVLLVCSHKVLSCMTYPYCILSLHFVFLSLFTVTL